MSGIGFDLIGVIVAGLGAAAVIYAAMHAARKAGFSPAGWLLPFGIGIAMVTYSIWNDYSWMSRTQAQLPVGTKTLLIGKDSQIWAPWTYLVPVTVRFAALDPAKISDEDNGIRQAEVMLIERRRPVVIVRQKFDCAKGLISVAGADWQQGGDDPAMALVCEAEAR